MKFDTSQGWTPEVQNKIVDFLIQQERMKEVCEIPIDGWMVFLLCLLTMVLGVGAGVFMGQKI